MPARDYYYCHSYYCHYYDSSYISLSSLLHALPRPRVNREETLSGAASLRPSVRPSVCPPTLFIDIVSLLGFVLACPPPRTPKGWKANTRTRTPSLPHIVSPQPSVQQKKSPLRVCQMYRCVFHMRCYCFRFFLTGGTIGCARITGPIASQLRAAVWRGLFPSVRPSLRASARACYHYSCLHSHLHYYLHSYHAYVM